MFRQNSIAALLLATVWVSFAAAETLEYNRDVRPILTENCFACHGVDSASREADLRLDQREAALEYGAIAPGDSAESELIARIFTDDPDLLMPPRETKKQLTPKQKQLLKQWIDSGAEYEAHWGYIPPRSVVPPAVEHQSRVKNAIDSLVLSRLEKEGLAPAPEANPRTLFRRLHLDIIGLPPKPADVQKFVADYQARHDGALSEWIDRLMEMPAWGEHRARYWLDAARYADTHGLHFDNYREMWPYRDWVIRSFNANQPFDQFAVEQLAGDLLPNPDTDQLIATGFQRCNITTNEGGTIAEENLALYAADRVQTFGWVFLGLTTNCAQCHDHKFDPFSTKEYYSLAAFFRNTKSPALDGNVKGGKGPTLTVPSEVDRPRWNALPGEIAAAKQHQKQRAEHSEGDFQKWLANATPDSVGNIPSDGLAVQVPLDEGSGTEVRVDASTVSKVKFSGPVEWHDDGALGPAPVFRTGSTLNVGNYGDFEKNQAFSYGAWVKTTKQGGNVGATGAILARMDQDKDHRGWDLWHSGNVISVHLIDSWDKNAIKVSTAQNVIEPTKWQHFFVTYDGSAKAAGIKIYVDGQPTGMKVERDSLTNDATLHTDVPLFIGKRSKGQVFDSGMVQDVRIYDRQLAPEEVRSLAKSTVVGALLAKSLEERSKEETAVLQGYYLAEQDPQYQAIAKQLGQLEAEKKTIEGRSPITHIQKEKPNSQPVAHVLMRGAYDQLGEEVTAAIPASLHPFPADAPLNRMGLAQWVVDPSNPLTARVTVNRFWLEVFGQGIVSTPEDFGVSGALPSNQKLLDWLAIDFIDSGWDVKRFFKQIFMSATYRQAAATTPEKLEQDPDNGMLSRGPRFRMDGEVIRDSALSVSGLLSPRMYGPGTRPYQPGNIWEIMGLPGGDTRNYTQDQGEGLYRRTIYNFWKRMAPSPNMEAFNAPSREVCTVQRERTNTPLQALVTLNDPQFVEAARHLALHALETGKGDDGALTYITQRVLARRCTEDERSILLGSKEDYLRHYENSPADAKKLIEVGDSPTSERFDAPTLAAWTMVCSQVMNLDEALNK
ncbi:DUF1553 domain-containing protein [Adhaeretor mobilis]|uniref:Planctomycete cytochrome C n=1 Tax=Adhaeretor mobilis TaxID=1930276 RepID=A0A517MTV2_9BACT|nr:DUF1553 domain-containing protein [Adhaeretor mobilis]QDS98303.1 Planctomycete cytochrome C [Adhaeretor mobilis]